MWFYVNNLKRFSFKMINNQKKTRETRHRKHMQQDRLWKLHLVIPAGWCNHLHDFIHADLFTFMKHWTVLHLTCAGTAEEEEMWPLLAALENWEFLPLFFKKKSSFIRFHSLQLNFPSSVLWGYYSNNLLKVDASTKMCMFVHLQQIIWKKSH